MPHAVFLRPRHALYRQYSRVVWDTVGEIVPRVELHRDRRGLPRPRRAVATDFTRARAIASAVQTAVRGRTSLTCSLGVGTSKVVCKIASDRRKPGGMTVVPPGTEAAFLAPLAVRLLPGVGPRAEARLRGAGVDTIGALAALADVELRTLLPGSLGPLLRNRARGIDPRDLDLELEPVSVSAEDDVLSRPARPGAPPRRGAPAGPARLRAAPQLGSVRTDRDDEAPLLGLLDTDALDDAPAAGGRRGRDLRRRLRPPRSRPPRSPGRAPARRGRRVEPLAVPAAQPRGVVESSARGAAGALVGS